MPLDGMVDKKTFELIWKPEALRAEVVKAVIPTPTTPIIVTKMTTLHHLLTMILKRMTLIVIQLGKTNKIEL